MGFQLVPKSVILNDLERRNGRVVCGCPFHPWSTTSTVCVNSLHFAASSSDLYWTAKLRIQRIYGVEQSLTSLARTWHWLRLSRN